ncbi:MAG: alcohol dehydrogenase, partial [Gammaproteobacteria bacterium HGW-Gammaproteobacteria-1]
MNLTGNWSYPTPIKFGAGRISELPEHCRTHGMLRPLLVTDAGLANAPITTAALQSLQAAGLGAALFAQIKPNPVEANLLDGLAAYHAGNHDGVVAFGGGSGLDMGKLIAFMSGQTRPVWDFEDIGDYWTRADANGIAPIIAVPTTAGTGSEVGRAGVITDERSHTKRIIFHPKMMPRVVICDPELTVGMPAKITAGTGMDAFSHCLEAYCAPGFHPMADGIAVEGIRLIARALPRVMREPTDIDARGQMMAAAAMGATAFQKGLGGMHALAHPIGALYDTHHGMTNATLMPYVLAFNRSAIDQRITRLAAYLGLPLPDFDSFLQFVLQLRR